MATIPLPTEAELRSAAELLAPILGPSDLLPFLGGADEDFGPWVDSDRPLLLKPELHHPGGSFKIRGVYHAVARRGDRAAGLETVSAGNTAQALAWCGRHFGVEARSVMPDTAPRTKIEAVEALGGIPVLVPREEVFRFLRERLWEGDPYAFIHPWIDREVWVGHGTLGLELCEGLERLDSVFVPVGGGGLLVGVASALRALRPEVRIVAVEPEGCPSLYRAREAGRPVEITSSTICDGVAVPYVTEEVFALQDELVDEVVLVSEAEVRRAIRDLALRHHLVVEGAGALACAAARGIAPERRGTSVAIVTGGSIDATLLASILTEAET